MDVKMKHHLYASFLADRTYAGPPSKIETG